MEFGSKINTFTRIPAPPARNEPRIGNEFRGKPIKFLVFWWGLLEEARCMLGKFKRYLRLALWLAMLPAVFSCGGSGNGGYNIEAGVFGPTVNGTPDTFRGAGIVNDSKFLFGGPLAQGQNGDILLQNDRIRVILQKPTRNTGVGLFGGNIIDADRFRPSSEPGQDQFGTIFPLVNLSWTVNYQRLEIMNADFSKGPVVVRATGILDVYDYIQTNIIVPFAQIFVGTTLYFAPRFDDIFSPFKNVPDLRGLNPIIVTEYTLKQDANYVITETRFQNNGETPIKMPVGDWVNGSGTLEPFVPRKGFVRGAQVDPIAAMVYEGMEDNVGVSYGYFYNPTQFMNPDGTLQTSTALTVSGVTPVVLGEGLLQVLPINGTDKDVKVNFTIEPGSRTITRYFVVGNGDAASVIDGGFAALGVSKLRMSGQVKDAGGNPVAKARVVVIDSADSDPANHVPVTVAMSDESGNFSADISSGRDVKDKMFGSGTYTVHVFKEGYVFAGGPKAGKCSGGSLDTAANTVSGIVCSLGDTGTVNVSATDGSSPVPARVTIVGFEPSPVHPYGQPPNFGKYADVNLDTADRDVYADVHADRDEYADIDQYARAECYQYTAANQHRFDVGRHIVRPFIAMSIVGSVFGHNLLQIVVQVGPHVGFGVFVQRQPG